MLSAKRQWNEISKTSLGGFTTNELLFSTYIFKQKFGNKKNFKTIVRLLLAVFRFLLIKLIIIFNSFYTSCFFLLKVFLTLEYLKRYIVWGYVKCYL